METITQDAALKQLETELDRLREDLDHAVVVAAQLERERSVLISENERIREAAQAEIEHARSLATPSGPEPAPSAIALEIESVETKLKEITARIDDPTTDLAAVIRMNVERSGLESYLKGIRFALGAK